MHRRDGDVEETVGRQLSLFDRESRYTGPYPLLPLERSGHTFDVMSITDAQLERLKERQEELLANPPAWPKRSRKYRVPSMPLEDGYEFGAWFEEWRRSLLRKWAELVGVVL